jgi:hypothetical protein
MKKSISIQEHRQDQGRDYPEPSTVPSSETEPAPAKHGKRKSRDDD